MLTNPKAGQKAQVWYREGLRSLMPLHGRVGMVRVAGRGRPRNHGVEIDEQIFIVPCGNLRKVNHE